MRGIGLVKDTHDIENIIVGTHGTNGEENESRKGGGSKRVTHTPIYVRDVADVRVGAELRQGAVTANGEGEAVAGIVLMLKGASGRDVV